MVNGNLELEEREQERKKRMLPRPNRNSVKGKLGHI